MYPLNDKDLDRLSRDAAEHYDVESSASGWERLESKLDKELPVKKKDRRRFIFWLFFIALLSGGSLIYLLGGSPAADQLASDRNEAGTVGKVSSTEIRDAEKKANENKAAVQQEKESVAEDKNEPATNADGKNEGASVADNKNEPSSSAAAKTVGKNTTRKDGDTFSPSGERSLVRDRSRKPVKYQPQDNAPSYPITIDDPSKSSMPVIDRTKLYEDGIVKKDIPAPPAEPAKKPEVKQDSRKPSHWEFGLLTGPDFNNVRFKHNYKTGLNLGVTVGYRLSDRWQVNTGFIYTQKWYKVAGEDFTPPKHSYLSYQDIEMVTGSCSMFEIPVNVRYDFAYNKKSRWFASTGVSNFIMDKQAYQCDYYTQSGQYYKMGWSTDSNYNYFMSTLNFSIGYERAIGKQFSIQAEPYFKLPLKGLGYGSIDMNSYGMYITFRYKPLGRLKK